MSLSSNRFILASISAQVSHANVALHVFDLLRVLIDLSLHERLVFLQFGQPLLQKGILLPLIRNRLVIRVADQLKPWHQVSHVV